MRSKARSTVDGWFAWITELIHARPMMGGYMYILRCSDGSYYVGSTINILFRMQQHQDGEGAAYTKRRLPVELVYCLPCEWIVQAFWFEKRVQGWSRAKREALINGDLHLLPELAKKQFPKRVAE